jgi:hypothetical protein
MGGDWGLGFLSKNDDITSFRRSLKVRIGEITSLVLYKKIKNRDRKKAEPAMALPFKNI